MNLIQLSWKNLVADRLSTILSLLLFALGVGLISLILLLNHQVEEKFEKNLAGIDLVVGAKGSPLQIILCSIFHIDFPTGNIPLKQAQGLARNPMIEKAIFLGMGDSYKTYRIVGTSHDYVDLYEGKTSQGKLWEKTYDVTLGGVVAEELGLKLGDTFDSSHGFAEDGFGHSHGESFKVVGVLEKNGSVLDQLILTNMESVWAVHGEHTEPEDEDVHAHEGHDHEGHDHDHDHEGHSHEEETTTPVAKEEKEITSMLLFFRNRMATVTLPRMINENTDMQAASPAFEMARLYSMMGQGEDLLKILGIIIVAVSAFSIFIALFNSLRARKYELALMRVGGASPTWIFMLIIMEGLIIAVLGYILGMIFSHGGMALLSGHLTETYHYDFTGWVFLKEEIWMFFIALAIGIVAAIIPAFLAFDANISETLSEG
ncbi:MAG: ABC transporter permease [Saprospiraceae bacterium]